MADVSGKFFSAKKVRTGVSPSSPGVIEGETLPPLNPPGGGLNSVGLTMPSAFNVANSPLTSNGSLDVTGAGTIAQYIRGDGTLETFPSLTGFVPYTGATQNVDLGEFGVDAGFVNLDTTPTGTPTTQGTIYWDDARSTAALIMNGTIQHIGQDSFFYVKNSTGSSINKGVAVRFDGTDGASGHLKIAPFLADGTYPSTYFMGVTAEAIGNGEFGQVMHFGELEGIDTTDFDAGDLLYASTTVAGGFQTTAPVAPNNIVLIAAAINSKNNGAIIVRPTYGSNINNDEGVKITTPTTGQLLQLQAGGLWENKTLAQVLGGTSSQFVKGDGSLDSTTYQNTADKGQPNGYASLDGNGKVPLTQINDALIGNVNFQGLWNASTNTPTLVDPPSSGTKGYYYIVSTGGTFAGITFEVGDWIISNGTAWGKVDNTDAVSSVFGRTGNVVASNGDYTTAQVTESGNLYYTDARSRAALSFAAGSGAYNSGTGVITIPTNNNQITNGAGYITSAALGGYLPLTGGTLTGALGGTSISLSGDITANRYRGVNSLVLNSYTTVNPSSNVYLYSPLNDRDAWIYLDSADPTSNWGIYHRQIDSAVSGLPQNSIGFIGGGSSILQAYISLLNGNGYFAGSLTASNLSGTNTGNVTIGTANGLSLSGQVLSLGLASSSANGALSSTDWTTFNNKQAAGNYVTTDTTQTITGQKTISRSAVTFSGTTQSFLIDGAEASGALTINSASTFYSYQNFAQGGVTKFEIGIVGTSNNGSLYINRNIQTGETGASIYIKKADGFVGINNINPLYQLDIDGQTRVFKAGDYWHFVIDGGTGQLRFGAETSGGAVIQARTEGGTTRPIFLQRDGANVIIGTNSDNGARLQVSGTASFSSSVTANGQVTITSNSSQPLVLNNQTNEQYLYINSASNREAMTQYYNATAGNWYTGIRSSAGLGSTSSYHIYSSTFGNDVFVLNTDGSSRFVGSVTAGGLITGQAGIYQTNASMSLASNRFETFNGGATQMYFGFPASGSVEFNNGSPRLHITNGGNVLIGTTTDNGAKLNVSGNTYLSEDLRFGTDFAGLNTAIIKWQGSGASIPNSLGLFTWGDAKDIQIGGKDVYFGAEGGATRMVINSSGNVGINTPSPDVKFHVEDGKALARTGNSSWGQFGVANPNDSEVSIVWGAGGTGYPGVTSTYTRQWIAGLNPFGSGMDRWSLTNKTLGANTALTVRDNGDTGIGTSSPDSRLHLYKAGDNWHFIIDGGTGQLRIGAETSNGAVIQARTSGGTIRQLYLQRDGGNVLIGTAAALIGPVQGKLDVLYDGVVSYGMNLKTTYASGGLAISFNNSSSTQVGNINTTSSSTSYNTSSDYRLKQDFKDFNGLDLVNKIKTYDFEWKTDKSRSYGVVAHELQEIINYAVFGEKDSVNMQGVDYSKLVPIMVKAIQELKQEIDTLKN